MTTLTVAIVDGHRLSDDGLRRVSAECTSVVSLATEERSFADVAARWAVLAPALAIEDGGRVGSIRDAIVECARRGVVFIATPAPRKADRFVAECLQGAAAATEFEVPGIAVHVVRDEPRPGSVAWLSDTGELSGYGVLFAVGYAAAHGVGVELIEPTGGLDKARTPQAMDEALARAEQLGVLITRHTDPSPFARVLRDEHSLVVHPVLDAAKGFNLLHPGELSHKAVATGSPAVVVELIENFPGDVVAVYDAVHLLSGSIPAARIAAGVALGVVGMAGVGTMVAAPASAALVENSADRKVTGNDVDVRIDVPGITYVATPHGHGATTITLHNATGHVIAVTVDGGHGHHGSGAGFGSAVLEPGGYWPLTLPGGVKQWTISPGPQQQSGTTAQTTPEKAPDPVVVTGTPGPAFEEKSPVVVPQIGPNPVVVVEGPVAVPGFEEKTDTRVPVPQVPEQVVPAQGPVVGPQVAPGGERVVVPLEGPPSVATPGRGQPPVAVPGGVSVELQQQVTPQVDVITPTVGLVTETPGGAQTPVADLGGVTVELQQQVTPQVDVGEPTVGVVTQTPDTLLKVGGAGVTSEVIADVTMPPEIGTPGIPDTITTGGHGPSTPMTHHHHTTPSGLDGGAGSNDRWAPEGELAHTGGNTAILAIVAGSLVAAGAGLAVAGRTGKDEEDHATPGG